MAVNNLAAPTSVMQIVEENGVRFISFDGSTWSLYNDNEDNPFLFEAGTATGGVTDAQRAQLIWTRGIPDGVSGQVATGTWLRVTEGTTFSYRLILSATGMSVYSLIQPT